jgi:hypothetical protein
LRRFQATHSGEPAEADDEHRRKPDGDPDAVTPEQADTAVRAGVASVVSGITGIVIWLD